MLDEKLLSMPSSHQSLNLSYKYILLHFKKLLSYFVVPTPPKIRKNPAGIKRGDTVQPWEFSTFYPLQHSPSFSCGMAVLILL